MNIIASNRPFPKRSVSSPEELTTLLKSTPASRIFFPYWSWMVPNNILEKHECIGFHTGDIRGGSPIQNIIRRGDDSSTIKIFRMTSELDSGVIIDIAPISLLGSLEEITIRQTKIMEKMIDEFQADN